MSTEDAAFERVIEQVMPLIYSHLREESRAAERFATHDAYQRAREALVALLAALRADTLVAEFVLTRVLPQHRPQLH